MDVDTIKFRVLMLESQKTGIEAEIKSLKETKCPVCNGMSNIYVEEPDPENASAKKTRTEPCKACKQTGYALGMFPQQY